MRNRLSDLDQEQTLPSGAAHVATSTTIVIISYNSRELLRDCLLSIQSEPWNQVIVVDNASSDGSVEMLRQEFPWVKLTLCPKNDGYGAAANLAIRSCSSKYVLLLNSDTVVKPGTVQALSKYLDRHPQVAIAGPQLVNPDGTSQTSCFAFPTPLQTLLRETSLSRLIRHASQFTYVNSKDESGNSTDRVPWVLGAVLAIRRDAFEAVGGFDESFFMYFEEVDLCYRLDQAGWQTHFVPDASVIHVGGASTKRQRAAMLQQLYKSLCHFYQQHYSNIEKIELKFILTYLMFRNILKDMFRSFRPTMKDDAVENLSIWRSILSNVWSSNGWL
jgi:GT2 family glycosyltransferase